MKSHLSFVLPSSSLGLFALCAACVFAPYLPQAVAQTTLPTKNVSIFKNGACMFTKEGSVELKDNLLRLPVPNAISSTYWLSTPGEKLIKSIAYKTENIKIQRQVMNQMELLELNVGKNISFDIVKYERVLRANESISSSDRSVASTQSISGKLLGVNKAMQTFKVADKNGTRFFNLSEISFNNMAIEDAVDTKTADSSARYAVVTPVRAMQTMTLQEISLQQGIQWIPAYFMKLGAGKEARLEMKALLENFSGEDINGADAEVVVGVPQLYFSRVLDPATTTTLTQLTPPAPTVNYGNTQFKTNRAQTESFRAARTADASSFGRFDDEANYNISFGADAEQSNDIFVYKLGNISLEKNSKASFPVFATGIEYKDIHECEIPDFTNFENTRVVDGREDTYDVFHSLEVVNNTGYPLTTAGIVVTDEKNRFLAQDLLKYIPKGGKGHIHLSKAINVTLKCSEEELQRTENVKRIAKVNYNRVRIKGSVTVQNFDDKEMTLKLKKSMNGVVSVSDNGKVRKLSQNFTINPQSEITWEITLPAGDKREISYEYETLFRQ